MNATLTVMKWIAPLMVGLVGLAAPAEAADGARAHTQLTRLVLDVTQITDFRTLVTERGRRILVGIPSVDWEANRHRLKPFGLVSRFDFMRRGLKRGLLVIHTTRPARIEHQFTLPPDGANRKGSRLVLDLVVADHAGPVALPK